MEKVVIKFNNDLGIDASGNQSFNQDQVGEPAKELFEEFTKHDL